MSAIHEALRGLPWATEAEHIAAAAALEVVLRPSTLQAVTEWLDLPVYGGRSARQMIEAGRGVEVIGTWMAMGEGVFV